MPGVLGLIKGAARLGWGATKVVTGVAVEKKIEDLLFGAGDKGNAQQKFHILGAAATGFGSLGKMAAKKLVQEAARPKHKVQSAPQAAHESAEATRRTGDAVQISLRQAARIVTKDFQKAIEAVTALDDKVVRQLDDLSDLFDRLAYRAKTGGRGGSGGGGAPGGDQSDQSGNKDDDKFHWRDFFLGRMSKGRGGRGGSEKAPSKGKLGRLLGRAGRWGGGALRWGGRALGALGAGVAGYQQYQESQEKGEGFLSSLGKGAAVGGGTLAGGTLGAIIGQAVIPIPFVGAAIGGALGGWLGGLLAKHMVDSPDVVNLGADLATLSFDVEKDIEFDIERDIVFEAPVIIIPGIGGGGGGGEGGGGGGGGATSDALGENFGQSSTGMSFEDQMMSQGAGTAGGGGHHGGGGHRDGAVHSGPTAGGYELPEGMGKGAIDRSWALEALKNPELVAKIATMVKGEVGLGSRTPLEKQIIQAETVFNRAKARGISLQQALLSVGEDAKRGYYAQDTYQSAATQAEIEHFKKNILSKVIGEGSNVGGQYVGLPPTGNASAGVASRGVARGEYAGYRYHGGEIYVAHKGDVKRPGYKSLLTKPQDQTPDQNQPQTRIRITPSGAPDSGPSTVTRQLPANPTDPTALVPPQDDNNDAKGEDTSSRKSSGNQDTKPSKQDDSGSGKDKGRISFSDHLDTKAA